MNHRTTMILLTWLLVAACAPQTDVMRTDLTRQAGVYIVGYTADQNLRRQFENQLARDLATHDMRAFVSHADVPDVTQTTSTQLVRMANTHAAVAIVVVNPVGEQIINDSRRVTAQDSTVAAYLQRIRARDYPQTPPDEVVVAEVSGFLIDGERTRLSWSGTTAAFRGYGGGEAITAISAAVAEGLQQARAQLRSN